MHPAGLWRSLALIITCVYCSELYNNKILSGDFHFFGEGRRVGFPVVKERVGWLWLDRVAYLARDYN